MPQATSNNVPPRTVEIASPGGLSELVLDCGNKRLPIVDYGLAHRGLGNPPPAEHVRLVQKPATTSGSSGGSGGSGGVIEHYTSDFTLRAAAGATMGALQAALSGTGQFLAIDADDDLTLGEVINHHVYGPLRAGFGSIRDHLLGLRYINGRGEDIRVGGRTVKNVAGLDVTRFMVGGLGEFGLVYEATLRTWAIPEQVLAAQIQVADVASIDDLVPKWLLTDAAPASLELTQTAGSAAVVHVGYFGSPEANAVQLRALETLIKGLPGWSLIGSQAGTLADDHARRASQRAWRRQVPALVKIVVPPASTGALCQALLSSSTAPLQIQAMPVHGCVFVGGNLDAGHAAALDQVILDLLASSDSQRPGGPGLSGFRAWYTAPVPAAAGALPIKPFAPEQPDWPMLARLKTTMDPLNLFNPGRLLPIQKASL